VTIHLALRLPKPDQEETDKQSEPESGVKSIPQPVAHARNVVHPANRASDEGGARSRTTPAKLFPRGLRSPAPTRQKIALTRAGQMGMKRAHKKEL
jgi:hypothetical protein